MTKSNDDIPADELLLAEAIAAAKARGMGWTRGCAFRDENGKRTTNVGDAKACCALGALAFAGVITPRQIFDNDVPGKIDMVATGNDSPYDDEDCDDWSYLDDDCGESLGWAFRCAMTQEEP